MSQISIWLDHYEDIFSDFDPRPLSERALSDDFLKEAKKVSKEKSGIALELKLLIPDKARNNEHEKIVHTHLQDYFREKHVALSSEMKGIRHKGIRFTLFGLLMMLTAGYISSLQSPLFAMHALFVIVEPAGWFLMWTGLDHIVYLSNQKKSDLEFYTRMANGTVTFHSYNTT